MTSFTARTAKTRAATSSAGEKIDAMVRRIVQRFDPEKVILFGSHARGTAGPDSDVDLLVVMPVEGSKRDKAIEIGVALHDIRVPKDIIVTTPEEFEWRKEVVGTIERPAAREGTVLYARP
jgi:predicted nucleotidyltransferase